jgi:hypothetical protein
MMRNLSLIYFIFLFIFPEALLAQVAQEKPKKIELNGYVSNMQSVSLEDLQGTWISDNLFHNRLNLFWYPNSNLSGSLQLRNRFMYGQSLQLNPEYASSVDEDNGLIDLSMNIFNEQSFFFNTAIDRAYLQYSKGNLVASLGRQRINWGQSFIWNPNDLFNVQNFFDFDYVEKQGSDAIRIQYYSGYSSDIEFAAKMDAQNRLTMAGYYRFNKWNYDIQFLAGMFEESDYVAGFGWAGNIKGAGFRGEMSYFHSIESFNDTTGLVFLSLSTDYTLPSSLYVQFECLYNQLPPDFSTSGFMEFYRGALNVKKMSFSEWNLFGQLSAPVTPLLNLSLSFMYFPDIKGFYTGPTIDYSLKENMTLSFVLQIFSGEFRSADPVSPMERVNMELGFLRYKWNF